MFRPITLMICVFLWVAITSPLQAQDEKSDWINRETQSLEQSFNPSEQDADANQPQGELEQAIDRQAVEALMETAKQQQAQLDAISDQAVKQVARDVAAQIHLNLIHSDEKDPLLRQIDLKQQELAREYKNYQVADRQIHNMTDGWIPLFESLIARGKMYRANNFAPPEDPADRLAVARQNVKESYAEKDEAAVRIWELRREIAALRKQLWSQTNQTPFDSLETDVIHNEKLNLWLSLEQQGLDVTPDEAVPSAQQLATQQALAEAVSAQENVQTQVAQEVSDRLQAYLNETQDPSGDKADNDTQVLSEEDEPLVEEEALARDVNEVLSGDYLVEESEEVQQLCDNILQGLKESRKTGEKVIEYLDKSGQITTVIDGVETVVQIEDIVRTTKELNKTAGEDMAMAYLSARVASLIAESVGGMYNSAGVYLKIGAKTLQVGSNVVSKATLGPNQEVPVNQINFGPNKAIRDHSQETDNGLRTVNIAVEGETTPINIYFWKQIYIEGEDGQQTEAWVPYDDLGNAYDYVFLVTSKPYALGLLGEYDLEVYQADTQQVDTDQKITIRAKGSYKN